MTKTIIDRAEAALRERHAGIQDSVTTWARSIASDPDKSIGDLMFWGRALEHSQAAAWRESVEKIAERFGATATRAAMQRMGLA